MFLWIRIFLLWPPQYLHLKMQLPFIPSICTKLPCISYQIFKCHLTFLIWWLSSYDRRQFAFNIMYIAIKLWHRDVMLGSFFFKTVKFFFMSFKTKFLSALSASSELIGNNYREHFVIREAFRRILTES